MSRTRVDRSPRNAWWHCSHLKDYWWAWGVVVALAGAITFVVTAPKRLEAVEQKNHEQDATLQALEAVEASNHDLMKQLVAHEVADDGEIKTLLVDGLKVCCDGRNCWPWTAKRQCARE